MAGRRGGATVKPRRGPDAPRALGAQSLRITSALAGQTLAAIVRTAYGALPWSRARELCGRGKVMVNGERATDPARRVREGDQVEIRPAAQPLDANRLPDEAIVYFDRELVVVDKPAGVLTVPFGPDDEHTLVDRVRAWLRRRTGGQSAELGAVQRLDKDTTGVLVFARTLAAKRHLQRLFRAHDIERRYLALVHGKLAGERTIDSHLLRDRGDGLRGSYGHFRRPRGPVPADAQRAITHVRALSPLRGATLVECRLETGRQHQIRIHLSELGHPLIGEAVYVRDYAGVRIPADRPMLHAAVLGFAHPQDGRAVRFERPPPADFEGKLRELASR
jgi:23S rRNA pseudouridine1911/1915/1917 synthase